jgi:hypothetical protein
VGGFRSAETFGAPSRESKLVRRSSAVCSAIKVWFGPLGLSSTTSWRKSERPEVSSAIQTSTPLRLGTIRMAATARCDRATVSSGPNVAWVRHG